MEDTSQTIAVIDKSNMLERLCSIEELNKEYNPVIIPQTEIDKIKDVVAQRICQTIIDFSIKYYMVIIPLGTFNEINDAILQSTRHIREKVLSKYNVIVRGYGCNDIFEFAQNVSEEFGTPVNIIAGDGNVVIHFKKENNK